MIRKELIKAALMRMKSANQAIFASKLIGVVILFTKPEYEAKGNRTTTKTKINRPAVILPCFHLKLFSLKIHEKHEKILAKKQSHF